MNMIKADWSYSARIEYLDIIDIIQVTLCS